MITLLKHEFFRTRDALGLVAGLAVLLALAGTLLAMTGVPMLASAGMAAGVIAVVCLVPATQIMLTVTFWRSSYGRGGYLTQTLPLKGSRIYWAKMLWAWLVSLVAAAVSIGMARVGTAAIAAATGAPTNEFMTTVRASWQQLNELAPGWGTPAAVAAIVLLILVWPTQYFFAASVGSQAPLNRLGLAGPVLVWIGVYLVEQAVIFASFAALPLAVGMDGDRLGLVHFDLFGEMAAGTSSSADVMPVGFLPALLVIAVVCTAWSVRSWNRRVSLV